MCAARRAVPVAADADRTRHRTAFAATGGRVFDKSLPAVLLIHGAGMDRTVWSLQARYLAHHGRAVLALDLPGHGKSAGPALNSIAAMADWVAALLDKMEIPQAALVGHSMGALIALDLAGRRPERVRALALFGVAERMPCIRISRAPPTAMKCWRPSSVTSWGHARRGQVGGHPAPGLWMAGSAVRLIDRAPDGVWPPIWRPATPMTRRGRVPPPSAARRFSCSAPPTV